MTRRQILFIDTDGRQYLSTEYNGDKTELRMIGSADSCDKDWADIEAEFERCDTLADFLATDKRAQGYYHSRLGDGEYEPPAELNSLNRTCGSEADIIPVCAGRRMAVNDAAMSHMAFGDYVFTPVRNAFSPQKTSWWLSKRGYTRAVYCFTADLRDEVMYQLGEESRKSYIKMFDDLFSTNL